MSSGILFGVAFVLIGIALAVKAGGKSSTMLVGAAFALIGVVTIFAAASIRVEFTGGQIIYQKKRVLGAKVQTFNAADAASVQIRQAITYRTPQNTSGFSMRLPQVRYQTLLVFKDGGELPLDNVKTSQNVFSTILAGGVPSKEFNVAHTVADFLHVPLGGGNQAVGGPLG